MRQIIISFSLLLLLSCGGNVGEHSADKRVEAYNRAAERAKGALSSEELLTISYELYNELLLMDSLVVSVEEMKISVASGCDEFVALLNAIDAVKDRFEKVLKDKEIEFYT